MIDFPELKKRITEHGFINKPLQDCNEDELKLLLTEIFSCPGEPEPPQGWKHPYIGSSDRLMIPFNCHPRYRWWTTDGQSLIDTLIEFKVPYNEASRHMFKNSTGYITEADYNKRIKENAVNKPLGDNKRRI